jgi:hypothetical protein
VVRVCGYGVREEVRVYDLHPLNHKVFLASSPVGADAMWRITL